MNSSAGFERLRQPGWRGKLLLLFTTIAIMLFGLEVYFRFTTPHIIRKSTSGIKGGTVAAGDYGYFMDTFSGRRLIPNTRVVRVDWDGRTMIPININAHGFREHEMPTKKAADEIRILVLGDSITAGVEVVAEHTYVEHLETGLNTVLQKRRVEVINAGVEGIGIQDEIEILLDQGLKLSPDIVIVGFYLNDGNLPDRLAAGLANPGFIRSRSVLAQTIYRAYQLQQYRAGNLPEASMYEWVDQEPPADWQTNRSSFLAFAEVAGKDWGSAWKPGTWDGIERQLMRLQQIAREHECKVVFMMFPNGYQVYAEYLEDWPQRKLKELCSKYDFYFHDLLPTFRGQSPELKIFTDGVHLTSVGHDIVGTSMTQYFSDNGLLQGVERGIQ